VVQAGVKFRRFRKTERPKAKTRREGRVFVDTTITCATAYPATCLPGRRARDVMPEAARALVSTVAV
jgi:hypothetical protein